MDNKNIGINLTQEETMFVKIPEALILNKDVYAERIALYCWLRMNSQIVVDWIDIKTIDNIIYHFSKVVYDKKELCKWLGFNPRSQAHCNNSVSPINRIKAIISFFEKLNILSDVQHIKHTMKSATFRELQDIRFVKIYSDEITKIIDDTNSKINKATAILVLAYLRLKIPYNSNDTFYNESYNNFYETIGEDIGIDRKQIKKSIEFLSELGIIYFEDYTYTSGSFKIATHIFTNMYKRDSANGVLIASGKDYYEPIVKTKKQILDKYFKKCIINGEKITEELLNENAT